MMKRLLTVLCVAACVLCLVSCDRYELPALDPEQPTAFAGEDIFYCNGIQAFDREGILLPDFEVQSSESSRYGIDLIYQNVTPLQMSVYRAQMKNAGFSLVETEYHTYFYSDTCFVGTSYTKDLSTGEVQLWWYTKSGDAPDGGLGADAAKQMIGTDCPYTLIDVTPEGVYDAAGGQIFYIPPYEREAQTDENGFATAMYMPYDLYFVTDEYALPIGFTCFAIADLDSNGQNEFWTFAYGPTSGVFTFYLWGFEAGAIKYQTLHQTEHGQLYFSHDGKGLCIEHKHPEYEDGKIAGYTVKQCRIAIIDGKAYVTYHGVPLDLWSMR